MDLVASDQLPNPTLSAQERALRDEWEQWHPTARVPDRRFGTWLLHRRARTSTEDAETRYGELPPSAADRSLALRARGEVRAIRRRLPSLSLSWEDYERLELAYALLSARLDRYGIAEDPNWEPGAIPGCVAELEPHCLAAARETLRLSPVPVFATTELVAELGHATPATRHRRELFSAERFPLVACLDPLELGDLRGAPDHRPQLALGALAHDVVEGTAPVALHDARPRPDAHVATAVDGDPARPLHDEQRVSRAVIAPPTITDGPPVLPEPDPQLEAALRGWATRCANKRIVNENMETILADFDRAQAEAKAQIHDSASPQASLALAEELALAQEIAAMRLACDSDAVWLSFNNDDSLARYVARRIGDPADARWPLYVTAESGVTSIFRYDPGLRGLALLDVDEDGVYRDLRTAQRAFVERDGTLVLDPQPSEEDIDRALRLIALRHGSVSIRGDEAFLERAVERAAVLGIDASDHPTQQRIACARERLVFTRSPLTLPEPFVTIQEGEAAERLSRMLEHSLFAERARAHARDDGPIADELSHEEMRHDIADAAVVDMDDFPDAVDARYQASITLANRTFVIAEARGQVYLADASRQPLFDGSLARDESVTLEPAAPSITLPDRFRGRGLER